MTDRLPEIIVSALDANGDTLSGAQVFFYQAGTTTKKDTYSDSAKSSANTNPMVLDTIGRFATDVFMDTDVQYKVVLAPSTDTDPPTSAIRTWDNVSPTRGSIVTETPSSAKSANFNVLTSDKGKLFKVDASSGSVNATLPLAADAGDGFEVTFKKVDSSANDVVVDGNGAETIDGQTTQTLSDQYRSIILTCDGTEWSIKAENEPGETNPLPRGYISGLALSNNSTDSEHDIDISVGECRDSVDGVNIALSSVLTKQIDASWVTGTDQGGLSSSLTLAADTRYYVHGIVVAGVSDVGFDTSATAANLVTDHSATAYQELGWVVTDGSSNIINGQFAQRVVGGKTHKFPAFATTSGTTVDITNIPAKVMAFDVNLDTVSDSATTSLAIELGDSGGIETTNYVGRIEVIGGVTLDWVGAAVITRNASASIGGTGTVHLRRLTEGSNVWLITGTMHEGSGGSIYVFAGEKTLSDELTTVRLESIGGTAFDGGSFSINITEIIPD